MNKLGGIKSMLDKLPFGNTQNTDMEKQNKSMNMFLSLINSMTEKERLMPDLIDISRKKRIAKGAGKDISHINTLLKQMKQMQKMMKKVSKPGGIKNMQRMMQQNQFNGGM
jgi:signal recognition particle subunit SRP54